MYSMLVRVSIKTLHTQMFWNMYIVNTTKIDSLCLSFVFVSPLQILQGNIQIELAYKNTLIGKSTTY